MIFSAWKLDWRRMDVLETSPKLMSSKYLSFLFLFSALVERYCVRKDIYPITNDQIHAELGGILFSIRESHNPQPRQTKSKAPKMPKMHMYGEPRAGKRKTGPPPTRAYPFKLPSFTTALDLSDMRSSHIS